MVDFALRSCGLRGHATFAPYEPELRERLKAHTPCRRGVAVLALRDVRWGASPPHRPGQYRAGDPTRSNAA